MNHSNSFSLKSFEFIGSIVPIASYLMVRSEFYNGAISSWVNILSLYWLEALYFLFDEQIHLMMNPYWCFITQIFSEMTHRPYILELYIINILFLSFSHPSNYPYPFFFISIDNLEAYFLIKKISVATTIWTIYHILTGSLDPDNTKWWVGYYFYSYLFIFLYYGAVFLY